MSLFDKNIWLLKQMRYRELLPDADRHSACGNEHSMTNVPAGMEIAYFAMGCFAGRRTFILANCPA